MALQAVRTHVCSRLLGAVSHPIHIEAPPLLLLPFFFFHCGVRKPRMRAKGEHPCMPHALEAHHLGSLLPPSRRTPKPASVTYIAFNWASPSYKNALECLFKSSKLSASLRSLALKKPSTTRQKHIKARLLSSATSFEFSMGFSVGNSLLTTTNAGWSLKGWEGIVGNEGKWVLQTMSILSLNVDARIDNEVGPSFSSCPDIARNAALISGSSKFEGQSRAGWTRREHRYLSWDLPVGILLATCKLPTRERIWDASKRHFAKPGFLLSLSYRMPRPPVCSLFCLV